MRVNAYLQKNKKKCIIKCVCVFCEAKKNVKHGAKHIFFDFIEQASEFCTDDNFTKTYTAKTRL